MKNENLEIKEIANLVLDLFTITELKEKSIKPTEFKWKFNSNNINLIPVLELYNNESKIFKTFESIEFSRKLQNLLRDQMLFDNNFNKTREDFLNYIDVVVVDLNDMLFRDD